MKQRNNFPRFIGITIKSFCWRQTVESIKSTLLILKPIENDGKTNSRSARHQQTKTTVCFVFTSMSNRFWFRINVLIKTKQINYKLTHLLNWHIDFSSCSAHSYMTNLIKWFVYRIDSVQIIIFNHFVLVRERVYSFIALKVTPKRKQPEKEKMKKNYHHLINLWLYQVWICGSLLTHLQREGKMKIN